LRLVRTGALPRAADYRGEKNLDGLVRAPLGILWFGDTFHHHKQFMPRVEGGQASGLPIVVDGVMRYGLAKEAFEPTVVAPSDSWHKWMAANKNAHREALTDVYTGRMLTTAEVAARSASRRPRKDRKGLKEPPDKRVNPLTGVRELRNIVVTYAGCGKGIDYGYIYTTRSGTGAFYDKRIESGTINISGTRSGCRNAIIAAGGVLLLPHWGSGCTCNYPNTTSLALASMPESHEQWAEWGPVQAEAPIRRGGINFGAPGDRMGRDGTLWIEFPSVAGVSPNIPVAIEPAAAKPFHRHALWIEGGEGQPWVVASGIEGARLVRITPIAKLSPPTPGVYSVRWEGSVQAKFSEEHTFHVKADRDMRLWARSKMILNGALLRRYGKRVDASDKVAMKAGRKYKIRMDYYGPHHGFGSGPGQVELAWASPSTPRQVVPAKRLFTKRGKRGGLTATYHYNKELYGVRIIQVDPKVQFDWSKTYPAAFDGSDKAIKPLLSYTVRLYFAEPKEMQAGQRVFTVALQRNVVLPDFDIAAEAGGHLRGVVKEFKGIAVEKDLVITLTPKAGKTLISGVELIAEKQQSKRLRNRP
jgi:hypothetical protein